MPKLAAEKWYPSGSLADREEWFFAHPWSSSIYLGTVGFVLMVLVLAATLGWSAEAARFSAIVCVLSVIGTRVAVGLIKKGRT